VTNEPTVSTGPSAYALGPGEGIATWFLGTLMTLKATSATTGNAFGLIEQLLPPGFAPPPHVHHGEDEAFYILDGHLTFICGEHTWDAPVGTFVFLPRDVVHGFRVVGDQPARLLQFNMPAGLEQMFVEAGEPAEERTVPPAGPPRIEKLLALTSRYNFEIMAPPPDLE
jgi:mannose-6-phosphate isomerase-like protein (cupin superfamily)